MPSSTLPRAQNTTLVKPRNTIACRYINTTRRIQIVRMTDTPNVFLERAVFPGKQLVFEAHVRAEIEVYTYELATAILAKKISCDRLAL